MKEIPLTRGLFAKVSDCDYEELLKYKWYAVKCAKKYYARRCVGRNKKIYMHRQILGNRNLFADHKDGDGLNNTRDNLRWADYAENNANRKNFAGESQFKGVSRRGDKYEARIRHNGACIYIGSFDSEIEAALAYDKKACAMHGEFAATNFVF